MASVAEGADDPDTFDAATGEITEGHEGGDNGSESGIAPALEPRLDSHDDREAAEELLRCAHLRIECCKVCSPGQLQEFVNGGQAALDRVSAIASGAQLHRLLPSALAEHRDLEHKWQQRSGTIRVVVRVRPPVPAEPLDPEDPAEPARECAPDALKVLSGAVRSRGLQLLIPKESVKGRRDEVHSFRRFDYVLGPEKDQETVFKELRAMLPSSGPGGLAGPPQSACVLAYGQTGSGKTHTMHGGEGKAQGLVPRILVEVFKLVRGTDAVVTLSAVEIYNDTAYDLIDDTRTQEAQAAQAGRGFQAGRQAPPPGLNFRHGCAGALNQAASVDVATAEQAAEFLAHAAERRSTRCTVFNATSSRSHSIVLVNVRRSSHEQTMALRLAFVDLAGSERLPSSEGAVAEESRHINLSLTSLGSVVHALRHRANHLPYRASLITRLLEPFFGSQGRVLLCICVSPEQRFAQETLCSLNFADRASRAQLGADSAQELQRGNALAAVRESHFALRVLLRELLPKASFANRVSARLPDSLAALILAFAPEHGNAAYACRSWSRMCQSHNWWGHKLRMSSELAKRILAYVAPAMVAASVCRCWWRSVGSYRVVLERTGADVAEASAGASSRMWAAAGARLRDNIWRALLSAGGGSGSIGEWPLVNVRECVIDGAAVEPKHLQQMLVRCPELRVAEILKVDLVENACVGLAKCPELRALCCTVDLVPSLLSVKQVLLNCRKLRSLKITCENEHLFSLSFLAENLPKKTPLTELTLERTTANWKDFEKLSKAFQNLRSLRIMFSHVEVGTGLLDLPPLVSLGRLKRLRRLDLRATCGKKHKHRAWLTDNMFGVIQQLPELRDVRVSDQKLLTDHCFWFLRRHCIRIQTLHLDGCKAMAGDQVFNFLLTCERLESLRLPAVVVNASERRLGLSTNRWVQGLQCPRLHELRVDAWHSLEDSSVRALTMQCERLRTLHLREAPKLSDDAAAYLTSLCHLTSLSLASCAGLTDRSLDEIGSMLTLKNLDLSGCRQLSEGAVVAFVDSSDGPRLHTLCLENCPNLGRRAAEAIASAGVIRCSLVGCKPFPLHLEAAVRWVSSSSRIKACEALGIPVTLADHAEDDGDAGPLLENEARQAENDQPCTCAICLDDIGPDDTAWQCPVCRNRLHDGEEQDCARDWLQTRKTCPTCRAAVLWTPPVAVRAPSRPMRPSRAHSADVLSRAVPRSPAGDPFNHGPRPPDVFLEALGVGVGFDNAVSARPLAAEAPLRPSAGRSRRPPRPDVRNMSGASPHGAGYQVGSGVGASSGLGGARNAAVFGIGTGTSPGLSARPLPNRSTSMPPNRQQEPLVLGLAGMSIVGSGRSSAT